MSYVNLEHPRRFGIRGGDGLRPIAWHVAKLMRRAGCPLTIVQDVLANAALYDDVDAAPPGAGRPSERSR